MLNLKDGTLWQWDIGRKMIVTLEEGSTIDKVQFYNGIGENAYPATSIEIVNGEILAGIPNSLLCYANNLTVYLMTTDEDGVKTQEQITLVVNKRAKPEDYIFTDDEFHTYKAYDERLQYLEKNVVLPERLESVVDQEIEEVVPEWARSAMPDVSLTQGGKAAEAAKVGNEISSLKAKDNSLLQEIAAERARINNLVANSGTQTEGNAELIDIRVGADGVIYPTAGEAVRMQARALEGIQNNIVSVMNLSDTNLFKDFESGTFYEVTGGFGHSLSKYDAEPFNKTRKRTANLNKAVFDFSITVEAGYLINVLEIENNIIMTASGYVSTCEGYANRAYVAIIKSVDDSDISGLNISDIVHVEEKNVLQKMNTIDTELNNGLNSIVNVANLRGTGLFKNFESGTYYNTSVGYELVKYNTELFNVTRKRTPSPEKAVFDFKLSIETGYSMRVFEVKDNVITKTCNFVNTYIGTANKSYIVIVRKDDESDISNVNISDILRIEESDKIIEAFDKINTELYGGEMLEDPTWRDNVAIIGTYVGVSTSSGVPVDIGPGYIDRSDDVVGFYKTSDYIDVSGHAILNLRMPHTSWEKPIADGMCFFDKDKNVLPNFGTTIPYGRKEGEPRAKMVKVYIPKEAKYFRTTYWMDSYVQENCPDLPFVYSFSNYAECDKPFTHELPINEEMVNTIKRARQLTDIKWEPLVDVPRYCLIDGDYSGQSDIHFLDWCKAESEYSGIPYSGSGEPDINTGVINSNTLCGKWGYYKFHMGIDVDFETFITACRYPNSIFGERKNLSQYAFDSSPYGTYCSALVGYALGLKQPLWLVTNFCEHNYETRESGKEYFSCVGKRIPDIEQSKIRLCDIIWNTWHVAIITDIIRDSSGNITHVEVSEATTVGNANNSIKFGKLGGLSRRKTWSIEEFYSWFRDYGLYRFKSFHGIEYHKSEYVDVGNENNSMPIIDMPCIPYLGNKARYKKGYIVNTKILIGATGFTHVVIEKDGAELNRVAIANQDYVEGGFSEIGNYSAYLTDGKNRSRACEWTVE